MKKQILIIACIFLCVWTSRSQGHSVISTNDSLLTGTATWYGERYHGRKMANGQVYDMWDSTTVATGDRSIPFGTRIRVTNISTGKSIIVVVRDRMARNPRHTLDLSVGAFVKLAPRKQGVIKIRYEILK